MLRPFWLTLLFLSTSLLSQGQEQKTSLCTLVNAKGEIRLRSSDIASIADLCNCSDIKDIWFKKMQVLNLPECLSSLDSLSSLSFSKSEMPHIPSVVFAIPNLHTLDLSYTPIYILPIEMAEMDSLRVLNLSGTFIEELPTGLDHLELLDMRNIDMNRETQKTIRAQYPNIDIYFSSPCNCK